MKVIKEPFFCRERPNSNDTLQQLTKIWENRGPSVRFHTPKVSSGVEIPYCKLAICKSNDAREKKEPGKHNPIKCKISGRITVKTCTHATVTIDVKKLTREEFTARSDPAREESIVSMSLHHEVSNPLGICQPELTFPKRLSIRPTKSGVSIKVLKVK